MIHYAQAADWGWDISTGYLLPEMPASGDCTPNRLAKPFSAKAMAARSKEHLERAGLGTRQFTFHSFRVGCAVTHTIVAGKNIAEIMATVNRNSETIARRYVGGATTTRDLYETTSGASDARYVAAYARAAAMDPAVWALVPPRSAPPRGIPQPLMTCVTLSPFPPQIKTPRKLFRQHYSRPTVC